jgi:hypothetical protein
MTEDDKQAAKAPAKDDGLFEVPEGAKGTGRYCVYDRELGRYVGAVTTTKPKAAGTQVVVEV